MNVSRVVPKPHSIPPSIPIDVTPKNRVDKGGFSFASKGGSNGPKSAGASHGGVSFPVDNPIIRQQCLKSLPCLLGKAKAGAEI